MNAGTFYAVSIDGKLASNCQRDPLVYFRRRDAVQSSFMRYAPFLSKSQQQRLAIKIVRVRIEVEK